MVSLGIGTYWSPHVEFISCLIFNFKLVIIIIFYNNNNNIKII